MPRIVPTVLALLLALAVSAFAASPAAAHGQLAEALPVDGASTDEAIDEVTLYFTEPPPLDASLEILGPGGEKVDLGWRYGEEKRLREPVQELFLEDGQWIPRFYDMGYAAVLPVSHFPSAGTYTVDYAFVATDGDEVEGTTSFTYDGSPTTADAGAQPLPPPSVRPEGPDLDAAPTTPPVASAAPSLSPGPAADTTQTVAATQEDDGVSLLLLALVVGVVLAAVAGLRFVVRRGTAAPTPAPAARSARGGSSTTSKKRPAKRAAPAKKAPTARRR